VCWRGHRRARPVPNPYKAREAWASLDLGPRQPLVRLCHGKNITKPRVGRPYSMGLEEEEEEEKSLFFLTIFFMKFRFSSLDSKTGQTTSLNFF